MQISVLDCRDSLQHGGLHQLDTISDQRSEYDPKLVVLYQTLVECESGRGKSSSVPVPRQGMLSYPMRKESMLS